MPTLTAEYLSDLGRVRLTAGDLIEGVEYTIQRSTELEPTWVDVRGGTVSTDGVLNVDDYEYTPNMTNFYRLTGPVFYDAFDRVYPGSLDEGFESEPLSITITQGTSPGMRLTVPNDNTETSYASTPDAAALDITGNIDLRADIIGWDFYSTQSTLIAKMGTGTTKSYLLGVNSGGYLTLRGSTAGSTTNITAVSTVTLFSVGYQDRERIQVRATRVAATGVVTFYYSTANDLNTTSWTQLGTTVTGATGNLYASTSQVRVGADASGEIDPFRGYCFRAQIRNDVNGTVVADPNFNAQASGATSFVDSAGRTWTVNGSASIGSSAQSSAAWARTNAQAHSGSWSLRSGTVTHLQVSDAVVTIPADATTIRFWYRVSTDAGFDYFMFLVDDQVQFTATGIVDWTQSAVIDISAASTVTFRYYRDITGSGGEDAVWIDDLEFALAPTTGTGWGTATSGEAWETLTLESGAAAYVTNGVGVTADTTPTGDNVQLQTAELDAAAVDAEITYSTVMPDASIDQTIEANVGMRGSGTTFYESQTVYYANGNFAIRLSKTVAGVYTGFVASLTIGTWTQGVPWHVRFRVEGSELSMRAWANGADEPSTWTLTATDTEITSGTRVHVRSRKSSGASYNSWFGPMEVNAVPASVVATASVEPVQTETYLKSVQYPSLNRVLECVDWDELSRDSRVGFYDIKGRHEILAITDVGSSASFDITLITRSKAENRALVALLTYGGVLLLQPPGDDDTIECNTDYSGIPGGYVAPGNSTQAHSVRGQAIWEWTIPFTRVSAPSSAITPTTITWQQLWDIIGADGTWEDVWATWATWQELWSTTGSSESFFTN